MAIAYRSVSIEINIENSPKTKIIGRIDNKIDHSRSEPPENLAPTDQILKVPESQMMNKGAENPEKGQKMGSCESTEKTGGAKMMNLAEILNEGEGCSEKGGILRGGGYSGRKKRSQKTAKPTNSSQPKIREFWQNMVGSSAPPEASQSRFSVAESLARHNNGYGGLSDGGIESSSCPAGNKSKALE